jgi:undecaprenyl-diphosphatase
MPITIFQALVYGIVQGLAEFLPISSSAHLTLLPWILGWQDPGLAFDVALHWGTLVAVLAVFWRDWLELIQAGLASVRERSLAGDPKRHLFWALALATVPGAVIGKLLQHKAEDAFRSPLLIAVTLGVMGVVLAVADSVGKKSRDMQEMTFGQAVAIGLAQACALVPGVSRSGATISLGLFFGYTRESIARFSFLMSAPIIFGAGLVKLPALVHALRGQGEEAALVTPAGLAVAMLASAIVGTLVIRWLLDFLRTRGYALFAVYRVLAALAVVALWLARGGPAHPL